MDKTLGQKLREARFKKGILAKALSEIVGISASELSLYENDKRTPGSKNLFKLFKVLEIDFSDFYSCHVTGCKEDE